MNNELSINIVNNYEKEKTSLHSKFKTFTYIVIKRLFDIISSLIGMIFLIPIALIVKITYVLNKDFSTIFYVQKRIGKNGKEFKLYKFRTMIPNAEKVLYNILEKDEKLKEEWVRNQKLTNDPRITKMGKILRKTSMDELPQLINILKNEMSLIGPRPLVKNELSFHGGNKKIYESVKPGITGWWACNGRSNVNYKERLDLEYYYIQNRSIALDIKCIFKTIKAVIKKNGVK